MPLALVDGELVAERKPLGLPEEMRKPVICVFDPIAIHSVIFDYALAGLGDKIDVLWQASFSRACIEMGGIGEKAYPVLIAVKRPVLLVSELEVIPDESEYGLEMLGNIRRTAGLKDVPLILISSTDCLSKAFVEKGRGLGELKINQFFTWTDLEKEAGEQKRLFDFVSQVLGSRAES